ncbi:hypothetical protein [Rhodospirillum sp. A1_3_36]|uniref:hypothetical protein n=1 Tax=Rhodospirillum sp. A1_3_36 TaxID=3391666 RepID=UPI0039A56A74
MTSDAFYPSLSSLVSPEDMPTGLGFLGEGLQELFRGLYYRDLRISQGSKGDSAFYSLTVVSFKELSFGTPGTDGLRVAFNLSENNDPSTSLIPTRVHYHWPIQRLLNGFDISRFSPEPQALFELAIQLLDGDATPILRAAIDQFIGPDDIAGMVADMNAFLGLDIVIPAGSVEEGLNRLAEEVEQRLGIPLIRIVYLRFILIEGNPQRTLGHLNRLFSGLIPGGDLEAYILDLMVPRIEASFDTSVAILFPRSVLVPVDQDEQSVLRFHPGTLSFSTHGGIGFHQAPGVASFTRSQIGSTGFIIDLESATLDLSRTSNIPEATADGRPDAFIGVFVSEATIDLPPDWFGQDGNATARLVGENLLIGTGGLSGRIGLRAIRQGSAPEDMALTARLGGEDGFTLGFRTFDVTFRQNAITGSTIDGFMEIPGFEDEDGTPVRIDLEVTVRDDGDFSITARASRGLALHVPGVFSFTLDRLSLGRRDDTFFLSLAGNLRFTHPALSTILTGDIYIADLTVYADGTFELDGGTLPLPSGVTIALGPAEVAITAIHFGSHQAEHRGQLRKYRYWGLDGGLSLDPGGVDARGDGIKFFYTIDNNPAEGRDPDAFLRIESLAIDLIIPGTAKPDTALALISGYVALKGDGGAGSEEYAGGVSVTLPKMRMAGAAEIAYKPADPSFYIDASVEIATPIPLGPTGLGIYGFRGVLGLRYVPSKTEIDLTDEDDWFTYYKKSVNGKGVGLYRDKFAPPGDTASASNPFAVGAGISLATASDDGKAFSSKVFLLLAMPDLILLEGKANVLGKRVGLDDQDPPFFAFLALEPESIEIGFGADYLLPSDSGMILDIHAEVRGKYFFDTPSGWYLNFGTRDKPISASLLKIFQAQAYLMLSARGIETAGRIEFDIDKRYAGGAVRAKADIYMEAGGKISFEQPQVGGYVLAGGGIDVFLLFAGFKFRLDTTLLAEAPNPFLIEGGLDLRVSVTIGYAFAKITISRSFTVSLSWTFDGAEDRSPVIPFAKPDAIAETPPVKAISMLSGEGFDLAYFGDRDPSGNDDKFARAIIPLDCWIDIDFPKSLQPGAVSHIIGGAGHAAPSQTMEIIPPEPVRTDVTHEYHITDLSLSVWSNNAWWPYNPYEALTPTDALIFPDDPDQPRNRRGVDPATLKAGQWQLISHHYNKIRLLADTPLVLAIPQIPSPDPVEHFGIDGATLFCESPPRPWTVADWTDVTAGTTYPSMRLHNRGGLTFHLPDRPAEGRRAEVLPFRLDPTLPHALVWLNRHILVLDLPERSVSVSLKLFTYATGVRVSVLNKRWIDSRPAYALLEDRFIDRLDAVIPIRFNAPGRQTDQLINRIIIEPAHGDRWTRWVADGDGQREPVGEETIADLAAEEERLWRHLAENDAKTDGREDLERRLKLIESRLRERRAIGCIEQEHDPDKLRARLEALTEDATETRDRIAESDALIRAITPRLKRLKLYAARCLPRDGRPLAYEIYDEKDKDQKIEYRWRIIDRSGRPVFSASTRYAQQKSARAEMLATLTRATTHAGYLVAQAKDGRYYFNIVDEKGAVIGRQIRYYKDLRSINRMITTLLTVVGQQAAYAPLILEKPLDWASGPLPRLGQDCLKDLPDLLRGTAAEAEVARFETTTITAPIDYAEVYRIVYAAIAELAVALQREQDRRSSLQRRLDRLEDDLRSLRPFLEALEQGPVRPGEPWHCSTLLFEVRWLTRADAAYNDHIPGQEAIEADYQATRAAIEHLLAPVWRPNSRYRLAITVGDRVDGRQDANEEPALDKQTFVFGFSTAGPVGHFHTTPGVTYVDTAAGKTAEDYPLTSLRRYLDKDRCVPDVSGNLLRTKPLFYQNAEIRLFYTGRHTYHLLNGWPAYQGLPELTGRLQVLIKDPAEGVTVENPPPPDMESIRVPGGTESWERDDDPRIPDDLRAFRNLAHNDARCLLSGGDLILPASTMTRVTLTNLKPGKLYTAILNNLFEGRSAEVHRFSFRTSRYGSFREQIESYHLRGSVAPDAGANAGAQASRDNRHDLWVNLPEGTVSELRRIISGDDDPTTRRAIQYPDPFERIIQGVLALPAQPPAEATEILFLRQAANGNGNGNGGDTLLAILIRNPEPLIDPRLPRTLWGEALRVWIDGRQDGLGMVFSKDGTGVLIAHRGEPLEGDRLTARFHHLVWNGRQYEADSRVNLILSLSP